MQAVISGRRLGPTILAKPVLGRWISLKLLWFSNFAFVYNALYYVLGSV